MAPSVEQYPLIALQEAEKRLSDPKCRDDKKAGLKQMVRVAREAVAKVQAELNALGKKRDALDVRLRELAAQRPFAIIRPSQKRQLAHA